MILFAYDFPHRKTQDFIFKLQKNSIKIDYIIAAPKRKLNLKRLPFRTSISINPIFHPRELADMFNIPYKSFDHNSEKSFNLIKTLKPDIGLISGARIISNDIIKLFSNGIINFHPGDIPHIRGLYSSLRAIKANHPQVVTSHLIDGKIDLGLLIEKKEIKIEKNETIFEINEKLYQKQLEMIPNSIKMVKMGKVSPFNESELKYPSRIPYLDFKSFHEDFKKYKI